MQYLLYSQQVGSPEENRADLHLARLDGSQDTLLLEGGRIFVFGWTGDSEHFLFTREENETRTTQLGRIDGTFQPFTANPVGLGEVHWLDANRFIYTRLLGGDSAELRLENLNGETVLIDNIPGYVAAFDYK